MEWFALSSTYWMDPKFEGISATTERLFTRLLGYCRLNNNGGIMPQTCYKLVSLPRSSRNMDELITRQIVHIRDDGMYEFPAWETWQQYGDDLDERKKKERDRKREERRKSANLSADKSATVRGTEQNRTEQDKTEEIEVPPSPSPAKTIPAPHRFVEFWSTYPRRQGKGDALKAYAKALTISDTDTIIDAAATYADDPNRDPAFTAHPATWLNGQRWEDDPLPSRAASAQTALGPASTKAQGWLDLAGQLENFDQKEIS